MSIDIQTNRNEGKEIVKNKGEQAKETLEVLNENKKIQQIQHIAGILFGTRDGIANFCYYTKQPQQCSDGSSLYTIAKTRNNKDILIKLGAGEFNTEVFNQKDINKTDRKTGKQNDYNDIKGFSRTPIPLFVINQRDSYLADDDVKQLAKSNPKGYLDKYSKIVVPKRKQAYIKDKKNNLNFNDINIQDTDTIIKKLQLALFETKFSKKELGEIKIYIKQQKNKTFEEFQSTLNYHDKNSNNELLKKIIFFLKHMVQKIGDIKEMYNLVQSYNINKNIFE